jgi:mRNA-degrading endonuclease toxin of MazEF toxin-antitoxin module
VRLALYASTPTATTPNLVALQDETFAALPTVLVCPLKAGIALTALRVEMTAGGETLIVCTELARPIRRTALRRMGELDEKTSGLVMERFLQLLARD